MKSAKILVIGSAHLDILAEFNDFGQEDAIDKIGSAVNLGFGGTALNISAWLDELGYRPFLFTAIDHSSFTGQAVLNALRAGRLSTKYVLDDSQLSDSAFVAGLTGGDLNFAVSYMGVGESGRMEDALSEVVPRFRWVVFDCNLSKWMIGVIAELCRDTRATLIGTATSDTKADRLLSAQPYGIGAVSLNLREAGALLDVAEPNPEQFRELRAQLNCETLLVTVGKEGWYLVQNDVAHYSPPLGIDPISTVGAGDAACAGLISALVTSRPIPEEVNRVVARALRSRSPTEFSERTSADVLPRILKRRRMVRNGALSAGLFFIGIVLTWFVEHGLSWLTGLLGSF